MLVKLLKITGQRHDPCVIDVFISAVRYMEGGAAKKWWEFTAERKNYLANQRSTLTRTSKEKVGFRRSEAQLRLF